MQIQAAVLHAPGQPFSVETLDLAPPRAGEVLVKIAAAGVCHSDWHLVTGATRHAMPMVAGHEGAGVGAVLNTARVRPGSSVAVFGAGGVGLSIIMGAKLVGASHIIAVDQAAGKLDLACDFGATDAVSAGPQAAQAIRTLTGGRGADY